MKTMSSPWSIASRCGFAILLAASSASFAADPPQRQPRPSFFARVGNAFQRLTRDPDSETRPVAQTKTQVQTRYNASTKSYQVLTSNISVNTASHWDGAVVPPTPGPAIVMRSSYSPGAGLSRVPPMPPSMPKTPAPSPDSVSGDADNNPMVPATIENRKQPTAATETQGLADALNSTLAPKTSAKTAPAKIFPSASFLSYGRVKSPFAPYNTLDVEGLSTGSLARDPSTGKIFRVP